MDGALYYAGSDQERGGCAGAGGELALLGVPCGILVNKSNIEKRVKEGFKYLVIAGTPGETEEAIRIGRRAAGR